MALPVVLAIGVATAHGDMRHGTTGGATAAATPIHAQVGAAIGGGSFTGPYDPDFRALVLTGNGGVLFGDHVGVGVRAMYFHGGKPSGGLFPEYEQTRVPIVLTGRLQSRYVFAELGVGATPIWYVDDQGQSQRGSNQETLAITAGLSTADPTVRYHPELMVGAVVAGDTRLVWLAAGLSWR